MSSNTGTLIEATAPAVTPVSQRQNPWALMGGAVSLEGCKTVTEVLDRGGLNWKAEKFPVFTTVPAIDYDGPYTKTIEVPDRFAVVRSDNLKVLGDVGGKFVPVQNRTLVEFGQALVEEADIEWDAGGTLAGGKTAFLSFKVPFNVKILGSDAVESWVLISNGHGGNRAFEASVIPYRVACGNQVGRKRAGCHSIRHVGDVMNKVNEARATLGFVDRYMVEFAEIAEQLAEIDVDTIYFNDLIDTLVPIAPDASLRVNTVKQRERAAFRANWANTETIDPEFKNTGWGALNVITEVIDHSARLGARKSKGDQAERRFLNTLEGPGAGLRDRAYSLLLNAASGDQVVRSEEEVIDTFEVVGSGYAAL